MSSQLWHVLLLDKPRMAFMLQDHGLPSLAVRSCSAARVPKLETFGLIRWGLIAVADGSSASGRLGGFLIRCICDQLWMWMWDGMMGRRLKFRDCDSVRDSLASVSNKVSATIILMVVRCEKSRFVSWPFSLWSVWSMHMHAFYAHQLLHQLVGNEMETAIKKR